MSTSNRNSVARCLTLALGTILLSINFLFAQTDCCRIPSCNPEPASFATQYSQVLDKLGPYPDSEPSLFTENEGGMTVLDPLIESSERTIYEEVLCWIRKLKMQDPAKADEILSLLETADQLDWHTYFNSFFTGNTQLPSPNFSKGTSWVINLRPLGVMSPYGDNEGYLGSYDMLVGRTIKRGNPLKDRRLRLNLGIRYQRLLKQNDLLALASLDWKLTDIQFSAFNIGSLKMHFQGFTNGEIVGGETGFGFETYGLGFNVISVGYQDFEFADGIYLQSGFMINIPELSRLIN